MGLYVRGGTIWWRYTRGGKKVREPSGFLVGQEAEAKKAWALLQRELGAEKKRTEKAAGPAGPTTLSGFVDGWLKDRLDRGVVNAGTEAGFFRHHIEPELGRFLLVDLRPQHVRGLLDTLKRKKTSGRRKPTRGPAGEIIPAPEKPLSSRTIRHIMGTLRCALADAAHAELIEASPFRLRARKDMPVARDVDPTWREGAKFTPREIETLISDPRIPEVRRVWYGIACLTGARPGEISALRWRHYLPDREPLGLLQLAFAFSSRVRVLKDTKTQRTHKVPVHPVLARLLSTWRLGWGAEFGRPPTEDDLILPARLLKPGEPSHAEFRRAKTMRESLHEDLARVGLRKRHLYDTRRSFTSMAEDDGISKDNVEWLIHGPRGDVHDGYREPAHAAMCAEILKIRIGLRDGTAEVRELRQAVGEASPVPRLGAQQGHKASQKSEKASESLSIPRPLLMGDAGFETASSPRRSASDSAKSPESHELTQSVNGSDLPNQSTIVPLCPGPDGVAEALKAACSSWLGARDAAALRRRLLELFQMLDSTSAP